MPLCKGGRASQVLATARAEGACSNARGERTLFLRLVHDLLHQVEKSLRSSDQKKTLF